MKSGVKIRRDPIFVAIAAAAAAASADAQFVGGVGADDVALNNRSVGGLVRPMETATLADGMICGASVAETGLSSNVVEDEDDADDEADAEAGVDLISVPTKRR